MKSKKWMNLQTQSIFPNVRIRKFDKQQTSKEDLGKMEECKIRNLMNEEINKTKVDKKIENSKTNKKIRNNSFDFESSSRVDRKFKRRNSDPAIETDSASVDNNGKNKLASTCYKKSCSKSLKRNIFNEMKSVKSRFKNTEAYKSNKSAYTSINNLKKDKTESLKTKKSLVFKNWISNQPVEQKHFLGISNPIPSSLNSSNFRSASTVVQTLLNEKKSRRFNNSLEEVPAKEDSKVEVMIQKYKKVENSNGVLKVNKGFGFPKRLIQFSFSSVKNELKGNN